jgi:drug/metabolite transporter (DMT)-like permease
MLIVKPGTEGFDEWSLMGLGEVACVVVRDLLTKRMPKGLPSVTIAFFTALAVTLMGAVGAPFEGFVMPDLKQAALLVTAAVFLIAGYLSIVMAMRVGDISVVAPFRYTSLIAALLLGLVVFGEFPDFWTLVGATIVIATGIYTFHRERHLGRPVAVPEIAPLKLR